MSGNKVWRVSVFYHETNKTQCTFVFEGQSLIIFWFMIFDKKCLCVCQAIVFARENHKPEINFCTQFMIKNNNNHKMFCLAKLKYECHDLCDTGLLFILEEKNRFCVVDIAYIRGNSGLFQVLWASEVGLAAPCLKSPPSCMKTLLNCY